MTLLSPKQVSLRDVSLADSGNSALRNAANGAAAFVGAFFDCRSQSDLTKRIVSHQDVLVVSNTPTTLGVTVLVEWADDVAGSPGSVVASESNVYPDFSDIRNSTFKLRGDYARITVTPSRALVSAETFTVKTTHWFAALPTVLGTKYDMGVTGDTSGTVSAKLRGLNKTTGDQADAVATTDTGTFSLLALFKRLLSNGLFARLATTAGQAYTTTAGAALPLVPTVSRYQRLRVSDEPATLLYDPFDSAALDTANMWNTPVTSGGATISKVTGGLQILPGTTASAYAYMTSKANFNATVPGFLEIGHALKFLASPPTGVLRFWGRGTVANSGVPTITNPITDGEGWELGSDAKLRAVVYASGVKTVVADLSALQAADGLYRRYNTQTRTDLGVWYLNSQDKPVCDSSFVFPDTQTLPLLFLAVNDPTTPPGVSSQIVCTGVIAADTAHNSHQNSDGVYPWRKQTVNADGSTNTDSGCRELTPVGVKLTGSGDTLIYTPTAGKAIRLQWIYALNNPANVNPSLITIKLGGTTKFVTYGISKRQQITGPVNGTLVVNLDLPNNVAVSAVLEEV